MADLLCPISPSNSELVSLGHGSGGRAMQDLIQNTISSLYGSGFSPDHDGAAFRVHGKLAFTTDSYVIKPLFFPGGDIGKLAIFGTINDLAMCGAKPLYLSCSFIIEEGFRVETLRQVCCSMADAARETGVSIITGDTKVVERGHADGLYINTSGIGCISDEVDIHPRNIQAGDVLILSGDVGRHGIAVMAAREGLSLEGQLPSDCASLSSTVQRLLGSGLRPRCLRDLTRGGLAAALLEISASARLGMEVEETKISVHSYVRGVCEVLGLDPIYIANEGRFLLITSPREADKTLFLLNSANNAYQAIAIGTVSSRREVEMLGPYGSRRILPPLQGELLPRIC